MFTISRILPLVLLMLTISTFGQRIKHFQQDYSVENKKAIKAYEIGQLAIDIDRNFSGGVIKIQEAIDIAPDFIEAHLKLAKTYEILKANNAAYARAMVKHYMKVAELAPDQGRYVSVYCRIGELFAEKGEYDTASVYLELVMKYPNASEKTYNKAKSMLQGMEFAKYATANPIDFHPVMMPRSSVNRWDHNSHPSLTADQETMILSVRRNRGFMDENIMICSLEDGAWTPSESISSKINTQKNEGMASISGDGKTMVFASTDRTDGKGGADLYVSYKVAGEWSEPKNLGPAVNSRFRESEPALSADGRTLYFSSDRPGGYGSLDIWSTILIAEGIWGTPENLGDAINTDKEEVTPFIHADGQHLYFASRGHMGLGGYDIYYSTKLGDRWSTPENLGYPVNTKDNEGSVFITPDYTEGYYEKYVSGANPALSHSDIYKFVMPKELKQKFGCVYAKGVVYDDVTKEKLGADIRLVDLKTGETVQRVKADSVDGDYILVLKEGGEYALNVKRKGYLFHSLNFDYTSSSDFNPFQLDVYLKPIQSKQEATLSNIFFESGSFTLLDKSKYELDQLIELLNDNPNVRVELSGHTDNVGGANSNLKLSQDRAKSVVNYLTAHGIAATRMISKGYGQTRPIADNKIESGRRRNRRIDIKVL